MRNFYLKLLLGLIVAFTANVVNAQNVNVNPGAGSYATLQAAFTAINAGTHTGAITVDIVGNTTETGIASLNASGAGAASYTSIVITPSGGAARTITGSLATELVLLNGADNVSIDGLNTGGNSLTISNTSSVATSGTSTLKFIGGATTNLITNCSILGSATMAVGTNGGNIFFSTDAVTANGNDNNTISNCNIGPAGANLPTKGIYMNGSTSTTAINNSGNIFNNNNIFDYFGAAVSSAAIYISTGNTDNNITNNKFYQTATRTQTTGSQHSAVWITNTSGNNFLISGNTIGFASGGGSGTYTLVGLASTTFVPIFINVGTTTATSVQGNIIKAIAMSGAMSGTSSSASFRGVYVSSGLSTVGDVTGNTIGDMAATGSITFTSSSTSAADINGIFNFGASNWTTNNNNVGGITVSNSSTGAANIYGIRCNTSSTVTWVCNNNTVGGNIANSINSTSTAIGTIVNGILNSSPIGTFTSNTVRNMTVAGGTGTGASASMVGIAIAAASANHSVSQNTIHSLSNSNTTAAVNVNGINFSSSTGTNLIARNFIHSLSIVSTSVTASMSGINVVGGTATYQNNMIRLGIDAGGAALTNGFVINGINETTAGTDNFYFNSVYIGGTGVGGSANTYAFQSTITTNTRIFRNNIFYNARSNGAGTGKHYAVRVGGTSPNPTGLTINNNIYLSNGTGGIFGFFNSLDVANLAAWKTAVGQDAGSFSSDPQYLTSGGTASTVDLHINPSVATQVEGNGANIPAITDDYDGQLRASFTPEDIGADAGNFTAAGDINPPGISYSALIFTCSTADRALNGVTISDASGVPTSGALQPRIYFKKGIGGTWFSSQGTLASGTGISGTWNFTIEAATLGGISAGDVIYYYVIAQDIVGNITSNPAAGLVATDVNTVTTHPTTPNSYSVSNTLNGSYNVGAGQTYTTLTAAIAAYNSSCLGGPVTFLLTDAAYTEAAAMTINSNADASATNTLTIKPTMANTTVAVTGGSATAILALNAADYITIDGSTSGGTDRNLTFTNTNSGVSSAVIWLQSNGSDGATNNIIKNLNITGNSNTTTLVGMGAGGSSIGVASLGTNNNSNTFRNNSITKTQYGVYSAGLSTAAKNTGNIVTQNLMNGSGTDAMGVAGILLTNETVVSVTDNKIANISGSGTKYGISLGATSFNSYSPGTADAVTNASVRRNAISSITCTSSSSAFGIVVCPATTGTNEFINNAIAAINGSATPSDFTAGMYIGGGTGSTTNIYYNSISMSGSASRSTNSFALAIGGSNPIVDVRNNIMHNISTTSGGASSYAFGTAYSSSFSNLTFNYNDLFTAGANAQFAGVGSISAPTNQANLGALNTTIGGGANSIATDPLFNSLTNLVPQVGSPVIGACVPVGGVIIDILGTTRSGSNPSMGAYELAGDAVAPVITYTPLATSCSTTDRALNGVTITDASGVPTSGTLQPRIYYRKNAGAWFSSQGTLATGTGTNGTWNFTIVAADMGGLAGGDAVQYYVIAQDVASPVNIASNPAAGLVASDVNTVTTHPTSPNSTTIGTTLNGTYTVGSGGNYTTLTAAVIAYNNACLTGPVIFNLTDAAYNTGETFPISINLNNDASAVNTLTIRPTGTSVISGVNTTSLITLNGARYVTVDGRIGSIGTTHSLSVANTTGPAVLFINDANNNAVKYTDLKSDVASTTSAVVLFSTTTGANGNDDNTIDNCNIGPNAANPTIGIYAAGTTTTTATFNSTNTISNNNIFDFYNSTSTSNGGTGVSIATGNTDWSLSGNSFFQTSTRTTFGLAAVVSAINITNTSGSNFAVAGNYIGGSAALCAGAAYTINTTSTVVFRGLFISAGITPVTSITNNTIKNLSITTTSTSTSQATMSLLNGGLTVTGNEIGAQNTTGSIVFSTTGTGAFFTGISVGTGTSGQGVVNINNNNIGGVSVSGSGTVSLRGISFQSSGIVASTQFTVSNNIIGSLATANSFQNATNSTIIGIGAFASQTTSTNLISGNSIANLTTTGTSTSNQIMGILAQGSTGGIYTTSGNTVRNITSSSASTGTSASASIVGILANAATTAGQTVSQNTVFGLSNTDAAAAVAVTGIHFAGPTSGTNIVEKNLVHSLGVSSVSATAEIRGISFTSGLANMQNNMIRLGTTVANGNTIYGLYELGSTSTSGIYFNSVYVGGSGVGTQTGNSYAFRSNQTTNTRTFQNNIFVNARSNASTGGKHYAVFVAGTAANPAGLTLNYNDYLATGTGGVFGFFNSADVANLTAWKTAVGQDANSISGDPQFIDATGASPDLHIHPTNPTPIESAGLAIGAVTDDFDGQTRAGLTPTDIGADAGNFVGADISAPIITYTALAFTCATGDRMLTGVTITDVSGVPTSGILQPRIYYRKNAGAWFSSQGTLTAGSATNGTWSFTIVAADLGGVVSGDAVSYYVIAQDIAGTPNISSNPAAGLVATDVNTVTTPPTTPNTYNINPTLAAGTYSVGTGSIGGEAGHYATITAALAAYNTSCLGGPVVFALIDAVYNTGSGETFPLTILANPDASVTNTLTIQPTVAATITGLSASAVFVLNGADYVTINGSTSATANSICPNVIASRDLGVVNTSTGTSSAVIWLQSNGADGATNNTVKNLVLTGNSTITTVCAVGMGGATISATSLGNGNSNNRIENNDIRKTRYGIYSQGASLANKNTGNVINQNLINNASPNNVGDQGIMVGFENNINISNNNIALLSAASTTDAVGINLGSGANNVSTSVNTGNEVTNATVTRNEIDNLTAASTYSVAGIFIVGATSGTNLIANNMLSRINSNGTSGDYAVGIFVGGATGSITNVYHNTVDMTKTLTSGGYASYALAIGAGNPVLNVRNNILTSTGSTGANLNRAIGINSALPSSNLTMDYNDLFVSGTGSAIAQTTSITTTGGVNHAAISNWRTNSGNDMNSVNILPVFTAGSNLRLVAGSNCALDGAGVAVAVTGITTDIDCNLRNLSTPDLGAFEFTATYSGTLAGVNGSATCESKNVSGFGGTVYATSNCSLIAKLVPSGALPVGGKVNTCVTLDATQQYFNSAPYVQRHFDIEPATNAANATGTVTLYFTDAEFVTYNTNNPTWPKLPTVANGGNADPAKANLKVTQYHGTPTSTPSTPGNYTGTGVVIPSVAVNYNSTNWEVTFDVTGFSGFYVYTNLGGALPITVNYFNGTKQGGNHLLNWKVTCNSTPRTTMTLERSADSRNFTGINTITADAARCNQPFDYTDAQPLAGINYYRLKMVDADGKLSYSSIVALMNAIKGFDIVSIAPNPVTNGNFKLNVTSATASKMELMIVDLQGRVVSRQAIQLIAGFNSIPMEVNNLAAGSYALYGSMGEDKSSIIRFVKQ